MDYEVIWWIVTAVAAYALVFIKVRQHDRNNTYLEWMAE